MRFFYGLIAIGAGVLLIMKTEWLVNNFGSIDWAEQHLGSEGGTRIFYKLLGAVIIIFAFLAMAGVFSGTLTGVFGQPFQEEVNTNASGDVSPFE